MPFIIPGNQLYLPDLGVDLREYFRQRSIAAAATLSPSAQAMLISALLRRPWQTEWQPSVVAAALGYTPMTLSRAVKELTAAGIATPYTLGRTRCLQMAQTPQQTWEQARPMLRTPVKRSVWVHDDLATAGQPRLLVGLSALAQHSMLVEPKCPIFAISPAQWRASTKAEIEELPEAVAGVCEWRLWCYTPALLAVTSAVDPLTLALGLQDNPDERIQLALDELKAQLPW